MTEEITRIYGHRPRLRVCGLCYQNDKLLMVNHSSITSGSFWAPPGGGVEFGESVNEALTREFAEETGLNVQVGRLLFVSEFIQEPLHAIELFFEVSPISGEVKAGYDPELQIIAEVRFLSLNEINLLPRNNLHGIFKICHKAEKLTELSGFLRL
ncbi:MAG: NUDIX hydrolase [Cyclobacteriaceae bacterium]|nr:NUDIX hydrolase [Cyclobacteriaceae bacterium]